MESGKINISVNEKFNRLDIGERTFALDGVKFLEIQGQEVKSNHNPTGVYVSINDVLKFIAKNLAGHDKNKFGIDKDKKNE